MVIWKSLVAAGLTGVYLSFDGLTGDVYETTSGRDILDVKLRVIERCRAGGHPGGAFGGRGGGPERRPAGRPSALLSGERRRGGRPGLAAGVHVGAFRGRARNAHERGRRDLPVGRTVRRAVGTVRHLAVRVVRTRCATRACSWCTATPPEGVAAHPSGFYPATRAHHGGGLPRRVQPGQPARLGVPGHPGQAGRGGGAAGFPWSS